MPIYKQSNDPRFNSSPEPRFNRTIEPRFRQPAAPVPAVTPAQKTATKTTYTYKLGDVTLTKAEYDRYAAMSEREKFDFQKQKGLIPENTPYETTTTTTSYTTTYKMGNVDITETEYKKFNEASDRDKFDFLLDKGIIPQGSQFVEGLTAERAEELKRLSEEGIRLGIIDPSQIENIKAQEWGYYTSEQVAEFNTWAETRGNELKELAAANIKAAELSKREADIAANEAVDVRLAPNAPSSSPLDTTKGLQAITPAPATTPTFNEYRIDFIMSNGKHISTNKSGTQTYKMNIEGQDIKVKLATGSVWTKERVANPQIKIDGKWVSFENYVAEQYAKKYGAGTFAADIVARPLSYLFLPARAMAADVTAKDIRGMEWAVGGAQIALLAAPGVGSSVSRALGATAGKLATAAIVGGAGVVMTKDTADNWKSMSSTERGISVAMDTVVVLSAIIPLASAVRGAGKPDIIRASQSAIKYNKAAYTAVDKTLGKNYTRLAKDQLAYAENVKAQYRMEQTIASATNKVEKIKFERQLQKLADKESALNQKLVDSGHTFVQRWETVYSKYANNQPMIRNAKGELVPVDVSSIPTMSESIKRLPDDLPRQTKTIILDSLTNGKAEIKTLQDKVAKLDAELKTLKEKYPTAPEKWGDVSADLQYARSKLNVALSGSVEQMQMQLQATRDNIIYLRSIVNSQADDVIRNEARALLKQAMLDEQKLTAELKTAYNSMDAEWTQQELRSGGGTTTATRPTTKTPMTGFGTGTATSAKASTNTMTAYQLAVLTGVHHADAIGKPMLTPATHTDTSTSPGTTTRTMPTVEPMKVTWPDSGTKKHEATRPGVSPSTETGTETGAESGTEPSTEGQTQTETETNTETGTKTKTETGTKTEAQPWDQTKTFTRTRTKTGTKTGIKGKGGGGYLPGSKKSVDDLTPAEKKGAIAWKQGIGWWIIYPPYKSINSFFSIKAPEGISTAPDMKSAFDTIQKTSGKVPEKLSFDRLGIVSATITRPPDNPKMRNRAAISFKVKPNVVNGRQHQNVPNRKIGNYYVAGNMVSRKPIGRKRRNNNYPPISHI